MLVPKRSVWIRIATSFCTSFTRVRSAIFRRASALLLPALISSVTRESSSLTSGWVVFNSRATLTSA